MKKTPPLYCISGDKPNKSTEERFDDLLGSTEVIREYCINDAVGAFRDNYKDPEAIAFTKEKFPDHFKGEHTSKTINDLFASKKNLAPVYTYELEYEIQVIFCTIANIILAKLESQQSSLVEDEDSNAFMECIYKLEEAHFEIDNFNKAFGEMLLKKARVFLAKIKGESITKEEIKKVQTVLENAKRHGASDHETEEGLGRIVRIFRSRDKLKSID